MGKVTYLFGAGASFHALPLVKDMPKAINTFRKDLEELKIEPSEEFPLLPSFKIGESRDWLTFECKKILEMMEIHSSIDTYAKKYLLT